MRINVPIVGFLIGLFLPLLGLMLMYLWWGHHEGILMFVKSLTYQKGLASKVCTMSLLVNLVPFVYFNMKRLDYAMRGIVIATMLYALFVVMLKFVW